jgi:Leucine-rich repeat (LRR) protein
MNGLFKIANLNVSGLKVERIDTLASISNIHMPDSDRRRGQRGGIAIHECTCLSDVTDITSQELTIRKCPVTNLSNVVVDTLYLCNCNALINLDVAGVSDTLGIYVCQSLKTVSATLSGEMSSTKIEYCPAIDTVNINSKSLSIRKCPGITVLDVRDVQNNLELVNCAGLVSLSKIHASHSVIFTNCRSLILDVNPFSELPRTPLFPLLDSKRALLEMTGCDEVKNINVTQPLGRVVVSNCTGLTSIVLGECKNVDVMLCPNLVDTSFGNVTDLTMDRCGIETFSPAGIRSTAELTLCDHLSTISEVKGGDAKRWRDAKMGCDLVTVTGCASLTSVTDVNVIELDMNQCVNLEKISGIPQLKTLTLRKNPTQIILKGVPKLATLALDAHTPPPISLQEDQRVAVEML